MHTWLRSVEADLGQQNIGLPSACLEEGSSSCSWRLAAHCGHSNAPAEYAMKEEDKIELYYFWWPSGTLKGGAWRTDFWRISLYYARNVWPRTTKFGRVKMWEGRFPRVSPALNPRSGNPAFPNFWDPLHTPKRMTEQPAFCVVSNVAFYTVHHVHAARPWVGPYGTKIVLGPQYVCSYL